MSDITTALARLLDAAYCDERPTDEQSDAWRAAAHAGGQEEKHLLKELGTWRRTAERLEEKVRELEAELTEAKREAGWWKTQTEIANEVTDKAKAERDAAITVAADSGVVTRLRAILAPVLELEAKATPGPWLGDSSDAKWDTPKLCGYDSREHHRGPPYYCTGPRTDTAEQASADADLIAAARNALPELRAALEASPQGGEERKPGQCWKIPPCGLCNACRGLEKAVAGQSKGEP
jgi:hypothetical protein